MIFCISTLSLTSTLADVRLSLKSGEVVVGEIVKENEYIIILRTNEGTRYQYLRTDIEKIEEAVEQEDIQEQQRLPKKASKAMLEIHAGGGWSTIPHMSSGGNMNMSLALGSGNLFDRHIFAGASIGYHAAWMGGRQYNFLPIQMLTQFPLTQQQSAPYLGLNIGYGVMLKKGELGGLTAGAELGWRVQTQGNSLWLFALYTNFYQCRIQVEEDILNTKYSALGGRTIVDIGAKIIFAI